jgi:hypothetical protein
MLMIHTRWLAGCLLAVLVLTSCGPATAQPPQPASSWPPAATLPLPSTTLSAGLLATDLPTATASATATATRFEPSATAAETAAMSSTAAASTSPLPTPGAARGGLKLVVLHSNDNWGETEPCG